MLSFFSVLPFLAIGLISFVKFYNDFTIVSAAWIRLFLGIARCVGTSYICVAHLPLRTLSFKLIFLPLAWSPPASSLPRPSAWLDSPSLLWLPKLFALGLTFEYWALLEYGFPFVNLLIIPASHLQILNVPVLYFKVRTIPNPIR